MKTILIMEDDMRLSQYWQSALEEEGFRVIAVYDPEVAIEALKENHVDLIISDMMIRDANYQLLPKGGLTLLAYINLHVENPKPKVIGVTGASPDLNLDEHARSLQAVQCFTKPIDVSELVLAVKHELEI